jgi:hypothetical protein
MVERRCPVAQDAVVRSPSATGALSITAIEMADGVPLLQGPPNAGTLAAHAVLCRAVLCRAVPCACRVRVVPCRAVRVVPCMSCHVVRWRW